MNWQILRLNEAKPDIIMIPIKLFDCFSKGTRPIIVASILTVFILRGIRYLLDDKLPNAK